ncbi:hypothetical protein GCM10008929_13450 [Alkalibacterium psychrotolerans]
MNAKTKSWINLGLLVLTLVVNALGSMGVINDLSQGEISDMYATLITPDSFAFSIWSVIYTLLFLSLIVMIIKHQSPYFEKAIHKISYLFWATCLLNITWIVTFSYLLIGLSTLFIFVFLIAVVLIIKQLGTIHSRKRWLLPITFGLYGGWLFIATVVNIATWLVQIEWDGFGLSDEVWTIAILIVAVILTSLVTFNLKNAVFPLPVAWGYFGIYYNLFDPEGYQGDFTLFQWIAIAGIVVLIGVAAIQLYKNRYGIMPAQSSSKTSILNR